MLTPGRHFLTPTVTAHVFQAPTPGPTAWIQAGIHGDEIAGVHALQELLEEGFRPTAGRLIVVPVMNPAAYRARSRTCVGGLDMNRQFPGDPHHARYEPRLAAQLMALMAEASPALVVTLHESKKRYDPQVVPSFGQTLVYGVKPCPPLFTQVVAQLNQALTDPAERWATQYYPVATSSTEVIVEALGCLGVCTETWMGFPEARRIEMNRDLVVRLLRGLGCL